MSMYTRETYFNGRHKGMVSDIAVFMSHQDSSTLSRTYCHIAFKQFSCYLPSFRLTMSNTIVGMLAKIEEVVIFLEHIIIVTFYEK